MRRVAPAAVADVLLRAERIERGEVELMGLGWVSVGATPNWHREPVSGTVAPARHWSTIPYLDPAQVGDHKLLWEFNRHQQWVTLAQAWALTGDSRWPRVWEQQLESWLAQNPATVGMNWSSSLEVAYRAISWCWASRLMGAGLPAPLHARMLQSAAAHGRHVHRYLSTYFSPNTHLSGEALGLFYLGTTFPELAGARKWQATGARILEEELGRQLRPDGVYFEQASQYHRYTAEIYLHYLLLAEAGGWPVAATVQPAVHRLFDVLLALHRADGSMALVGDDDGGRLVQLDGAKPHDLRGLFSAGAVALERADLAHAGAGDTAMALWLFGADVPSRLAGLRSREWTPEGAQAFPLAGVFVVRDDPRGAGTGHATIDAGPHGALSYGHSHADALAVDLYAGGGPLFVDAGTATYVGTARNRFRGTESHNTVELDGTGICEPGTAFRWRSVTDGVMDEWVYADGLAWFAGHHDGYERLPVPAVHERALFHPATGVWVVRDGILSQGEHDLVLRWHCDPSVTPSVGEPVGGMTAIDLTRDGRRVATLLLALADGSVTVESGEVSPQFGRVDPARVVVLRARTRGDVQACSVVLDWVALGADAGVSVTIGTQTGMLGACGSLPSAGLPTHVLHLDSGAEHDFGACRVVAGLVCGEMTGGETTRLAAACVRRAVASDGTALVTGTRPDQWFVATRQLPQWRFASGFLTSNAT